MSRTVGVGISTVLCSITNVTGIDGAYIPGMNDVVREVKEAARVREDALLNRVKALRHSKHQHPLPRWQEVIRHDPGRRRGDRAQSESGRLRQKSDKHADKGRFISCSQDQIGMLCDWSVENNSMECILVCKGREYEKFGNFFSLV
uniref:Uncharacterized protein n=1 Tax=Glossina pallidipes TaxID=7398 RepID=A0A1A9ZND4_GLOPL